MLTAASVSSVQLLSRVRLFVTPWIAAHQASLSITNSRSSLRLTSLESVMPSSHLILCRPLLLLPPIPPSISIMSQPFAWGGQSTGVSALASFLPKKSQGWSPSEWTGWISLQSKGLLRVFSNTTVQKHQFLAHTNSFPLCEHSMVYLWNLPVSGHGGSSLSFLPVQAMTAVSMLLFTYPLCVWVCLWDTLLHVELLG